MFSVNCRPKGTQEWPRSRRLSKKIHGYDLEIFQCSDDSCECPSSYLWLQKHFSKLNCMNSQGTKIPKYLNETHKLEYEKSIYLPTVQKGSWGCKAHFSVNPKETRETRIPRPTTPESPFVYILPYYIHLYISPLKMWILFSENNISLIPAIVFILILLNILLKWRTFVSMCYQEYNSW